jgi:hypothetical protein
MSRRCRHISETVQVKSSPVSAFLGEHAELMGQIDALWHGGDLAAADELYAPDFTANGRRVGPAGVKEALRRLRASFSEMSYELQEQIVADDRFVVRWEHTGRHTGTWDSRRRDSYLTRAMRLSRIRNLSPHI